MPEDGDEGGRRELVIRNDPSNAGFTYYGEKGIDGVVAALREELSASGMAALETEVRQAAENSHDEAECDVRRLVENVVLLNGAVDDALYDAVRYQHAEYDHVRNDLLEEIEHVRDLAEEILERAAAPDQDDVEHSGRSYRVRCPDCGVTIGASSTFCASCGAEVGDRIGGDGADA